MLLSGLINLVAPLGGTQDNQWVIRAVAPAAFFVIALLDDTRGINRFGPDRRVRVPAVPDAGTRSALLRRVDRWTIIGLTMTGAVALFATVLAGSAGKLVPRSWMQRAGEAELAASVPELYRCQAP